MKHLLVLATLLVAIYMLSDLTFWRGVYLFICGVHLGRYLETFLTQSKEGGE